MSTLTDPENAAHDRTLNDDIDAITASKSGYPYEQDGRTAREMAHHKAEYPWMYNEAGDYDPRFQDRPEMEEKERMGIHVDKHIPGCPLCTQDSDLDFRVTVDVSPDQLVPNSIHEEAQRDEDKYAAMEQEPLTQEDLDKGHSSPHNPKPTDMTQFITTDKPEPFKQTYLQDLEPAISTNKPMTQAEALNHQQQMFDDALIIMQKKRFDYSGTVDPFKNLRDAAFVGVDPLQGVMVRIMDKFARIRSFIEEGTLKVNDESTRDTLVDVLNYTCILAAMIEEEN